MLENRTLTRASNYGTCADCKTNGRIWPVAKRWLCGVCFMWKTGTRPPR